MEKSWLKKKIRNHNNSSQTHNTRPPHGQKQPILCESCGVEYSVKHIY